MAAGKVGSYEIVRRIGRGGMGTVYLARQGPPFDRLVAVKEMNLGDDDPRAASRFLNEARIVGQLSHENVVPVFDYFDHEGVPYLAMQYHERGSLARRIGDLTPPQIMFVLHGILSALVAAERRQIVHRDLKPANVLVTDSGNVQVCDFGLAKALRETRLASASAAQMVGTPAYMAPEQARKGHESPASDLYSTGVMAYEMLVGQLPFEGTNEVALVLAHISDPVPDPIEINGELDSRYADWLKRMLAKDPADRPAGAVAAWEELEGITVDVLGALWRRHASLWTDQPRPEPEELAGAGPIPPLVVPQMRTLTQPDPAQETPADTPASGVGLSFPSARGEAAYLIHVSLAAGVNEVAEAIRPTLGPRGSYVVLSSGPDRHRTRRGAEIVGEIAVDDVGQQEGVELARQLAKDMSARTGEGATIAVLLAQRLVSGIVDAERAGRDRRRVLAGIASGVEQVITHVGEISTEITGKGQIARVATLTSDDEEIGELIADAIEKVGKDGVVTVEEGQTFGMDLEFTEGMQFDKGYISPHMVTDQERVEAVLEDPYVLIANQRIGPVRELLPVLEKVIQSDRPLLIIAEDVEGEALATLVLNKTRGTFTAVAVKAPGFGDRRKRILEDIAILTGGEVITEEMRLKLEDTQLSQLGRARRAVLSRDMTTLVDGAGDSDAIIGRINQIKSEIENTDSDFDREKLQERLAKLSGGVAVVKVSAASETEMKEKKHRVEDALQASRAALEEGIVPGGGVALLRAEEVLDLDEVDNDDMRAGVALVRAALADPLRQLVDNAGFDGDAVAAQVRELGPFDGFDVLTGKYVDLVEAGIIDAAATQRTALGLAAALAEEVAMTERILPRRALPAAPAPAPPAEAASLAPDDAPSTQ